MVGGFKGKPKGAPPFFQGSDFRAFPEPRLPFSQATQTANPRKPATQRLDALILQHSALERIVALQCLPFWPIEVVLTNQPTIFSGLQRPFGF